MDDKQKYQIYIVALDDSILKRKDFQERNPHHRKGKPCLYVGQTAKDPQERFDQHLAGGKFSSKKVKRYGKYLRKQLFKNIASVNTREEAEKLEEEVAKKLQSKGYAVWWN